MSLLNNARAPLGVALFASVLFLPPYVVAAVACIIAARWRAWEVIAAGMLMDFLWLPSPVSFLSLDTLPLATFICIVAVFGLEPLRRQLLVGPELE